jgi:hypothetical protein
MYQDTRQAQVRLKVKRKAVARVVCKRVEERRRGVDVRNWKGSCVWKFLQRVKAERMSIDEGH